MAYTIATNIAQSFMMLCSCVAVVTGYFNRKRFHALRKFYWYPLLSLVQMTVFYVVELCQVSRHTKNNIVVLTANIFLVAEFFLIYSFFLNALKTKAIKKLLYTIQVVYSLA